MFKNETSAIFACVEDFFKKPKEKFTLKRKMIWKISISKWIISCVFFLCLFFDFFNGFIISSRRSVVVVLAQEIKKTY